MSIQHLAIKKNVLLILSEIYSKSEEVGFNFNIYSARIPESKYFAFLSKIEDD